MTQTLSSFIEKLERLNTGSFIDGVRRQVAADGLKLINAGYRDSTDPYGNRWHALKSSFRKPLVLTGAFRDTWVAYPTPTGVRFVSGVYYGAFHQYGTKTIPVRMVVPKTYLGLPKPWNDAISKAYTKQVRGALA